MKTAAVLCLVIFYACILLPFNLVDAFRSQSPLQLKTFHALGKVNPLQTAGGELGVPSSIPRLEPGLRITKSIAEVFARGTDAIQFTSFSLKKLMEFDKMMVIADDEEGSNARNIPLTTLFAEAKRNIVKISDVFIKYFRKVLAASMIIASSVSPTSVKRASIAAGTILTTIAAGPKVIARAGVLKKYQSLSATQRLATTPLYFVSNSRGNPYLQDDIQAGKPEQKIVVYFMSSEDANDYLEEMSQINNANMNELRVMTVSMEKVMNQIQSKKQSRKLGRYEMDLVYRIQPSSRQCENAERLVGKKDARTGKISAKALEGVAIPMFSADGLAIKRANGEFVTPYYFAYEDLLEDWTKMATNLGEQKNIPKEPKVHVRDFTEVMCLAQGISKDSVEGKDMVTALLDQSSSSTSSLTSEQIKLALQTPGIVPPRREIEMIKSFYRNKIPNKNEYAKSKLLLK